MIYKTIKWVKLYITDLEVERQPDLEVEGPSRLLLNGALT